MNRSEVESLLYNNYGLSPQIVEAILAECRPAARMRLIPEPGADLPIRSSRFGGEPDLPPHAPWPRRTSRRFLTFVAQINLSECATLLEPFWPRDGLLSIFYDAGDAPIGYAIEDYDSFRLLYFEPEVELIRTPRPKPLRDPDPSPRPELPTATIMFENLCSCPPVITLRSIDGVTQEDIRNYYNFFEESILKDMRSDCHQLGGHPIELQEGGAYVAACSRAGISLDALPSGHPRKQELPALAIPWRLLLQFDSDRKLQVSWKYGGDRLYFWIHEDSLRKWTFDRCWVTSDVD